MDDVVKPCPKCGEPKESRKAPYCRKCFSQYMTKRQTEKRTAGQMTDNQRYLKGLRVEVLAHYSGSEQPHCVCCGEAEYGFLTIDHIGGGGKEHRKVVRGDKLPKWLIDNDYPDGYRTLCWNCNSATGVYGCCPHQIQRGEEVRHLLKPQYHYLLNEKAQPTGVSAGRA